MDVRIEKTKKKLRDALKKLSRVQPIDQISVSRLCQEASINRTTFYKYYAVPSDIEKELIDEALEEIAKTMHREEGTDIAVTIRLGLRLMIQEIGKEGVEYVSASVMEKYRGRHLTGGQTLAGVSGDSGRAAGGRAGRVYPRPSVRGRDCRQGVRL